MGEKSREDEKMREKSRENEIGEDEKSSEDNMRRWEVWEDE